MAVEPEISDLQELVGKNAIVAVRREFAQAVERLGWVGSTISTKILGVVPQTGLWVSPTGPILGEIRKGARIFFPFRAIAGIILR